MKNIEIENFAKSFGVNVSDLSQVTLNEIGKHNFNYKQITGEALEKLILQILKKIESDNQIIGDKKRTAAWDGATAACRRAPTGAPVWRRRPLPRPYGGARGAAAALHASEGRRASMQGGRQW